jgi:rsbT co-antagonist protein RsbR
MASDAAKFDEREIDALRTEVERMGRRIAELEAELGAEGARLDLLESIMQKSDILFYVFDYEYGGNVFASRDMARMIGYTEDEIQTMGGQILPTIIHPDDAARIPAQIALVMAAKDGEVILLEYRLRDHGGAYRWVEDRIVVLSRNADGGVRQHLGMVYDITERKSMIRELACPLLPIAENIVVMPIIGSIHEARVEQIMETLLQNISRMGTRIAILDITGVRAVDAQVARGLAQVAQAAKLLGARVALTGMSPAVAQALVSLGVDLHGIITLGTLEAGITWAMQRQSGER